MPSKFLHGFLKIDTWIFLWLLHGFVKTDTWISLYCYMDLSKLFYISHALCHIKPSCSFTETSKLVEASAFNLSCWMIHQSTQLHGFVVPLSMFCLLLSIIFIWLWFWCMSLNIEVKLLVYVQLVINIIDIIYFNISIKTKCEYVGLVNIEGERLVCYVDPVPFTHSPPCVALYSIVLHCVALSSTV